MVLKGQFKVLKKKAGENGGSPRYDLGCVDTFSKVSLNINQDLEVGKVYPLEIPVTFGQGKYGTYVQAVA